MYNALFDTYTNDGDNGFQTYLYQLNRLLDTNIFVYEQEILSGKFVSTLALLSMESLVLVGKQALLINDKKIFSNA
jgi:hypothetical protein